MNQTDLLNASCSSVEQARDKMYKLLSERNPDYSLPQPLYNDPYMFRADMEEIFEKENGIEYPSIPNWQ